MSFPRREDWSLESPASWLGSRALTCLSRVLTYVSQPFHNKVSRWRALRSFTWHCFRPRVSGHGLFTSVSGPRETFRFRSTRNLSTGTDRLSVPVNLKRERVIKKKHDLFPKKFTVFLTSKRCFTVFLISKRCFTVFMEMCFEFKHWSDKRHFVSFVLENVWAWLSSFHGVFLTNFFWANCCKTRKAFLHWT